MAQDDWTPQNGFLNGTFFVATSEVKIRSFSLKLLWTFSALDSVELQTSQNPEVFFQFQYDGVFL